MNTACEKAVSEYLATLKGGFEVDASADECIIVTPFLRPDNSAIEISVASLPSGLIEISDNAETIDYLFVNGLKIEGRNFADKLNIIAHRFGVDITADEIRTETTQENLGDRIQAILGAIQDVTYLIYNRARGGPSTFDDRVEKVLIAKDIRYQYGITIPGEKDHHTFKFYINGDRRLSIEPLTARRESSARVKARQLAYHVVDIKRVSPEYSFMAVLDDSPSGIAEWEEPEIFNPLRYCDYIIRWSEREKIPEVILKR